MNVQIAADVPPPSPADSVFVQMIAPSGCTRYTAQQQNVGCHEILKKFEAVLSLFAVMAA